MPHFFTEPKDTCRIPFADLCLRDEKHRTFFMRKTYGPSQCVQPQGAKISAFGIVESGILKAVNHTANGVEMCQAYFEAKDLFPEFLYFTGRQNYGYYLIAEKKSAVVWIPTHVMEEMLQEEPQLMHALLLYISERGLKNQLYLNCLNYQTIRGRIAFWIVGMHNLAPSQSICVPCSQQMLANMLHVSRASLNQELKQMEKEGIFRIEKRELMNIDEERLLELL